MYIIYYQYIFTYVNTRKYIPHILLVGTILMWASLNSNLREAYWWYE